MNDDALGRIAGVLRALYQDTPTLRDRFAMAALQGLLATNKSVTYSAQLAWQAADAMIATREKVE